MRHLVFGKKLSRNSAHRASMLRNMSISLFRHEKIITTHVKAMFLKAYVEKIITLAKRAASNHNSVISLRRLALSRLYGDTEIVQKVFGGIATRYKERSGGYTRVIKYRVRSDGALISVIELV